MTRYRILIQSKYITPIQEYYQITNYLFDSHNAEQFETVLKGKLEEGFYIQEELGNGITHRYVFITKANLIEDRR